MLANIIFPGQMQWRSHEYQAAREVFGEIEDCPGATPQFAQAEVVRWFPPSENCDEPGYVWMQQQRDLSKARWHINDVRNYLKVHDKVGCFDVWKNEGIPIPRFFTWNPGHFAEQREIARLDPPFLLRLNNSVAGQDSWLVKEESQVKSALAEVEARYARAGGALNRLLCTEFIDTTSGFTLIDMNVSFRIIVAGGKVVTGYARVSEPSDWVAVTNKFGPKIADGWMFWNCRCQEIMTTQADLLVKAVEVLGLNHQALDVIPGPNGQLYFLEVQTTYDAGFIGCGPYLPPYYNPYNPELVKFIQQNERMLKEKIPLYYHLWLDKLAHFRTCYVNLKATFQ